MNRLYEEHAKLRISGCAAVLSCLLVNMTLLGAEPPDDHSIPPSITTFLKSHCVGCHGAMKQEADLRLDDLTGGMSKDGERWRAIGEQLRDGLMPPEDQPRPDPTKLKQVADWIASRLERHAAPWPNQGNLIPHESLFGTPAVASQPPPPRVWRLSPSSYDGFVKDVHRGRADGIVQPFTLFPDRGIKDFAGLYSVDEPSTEILLRNAETIVNAQSSHTLKEGKVQMNNDTVGEFKPLLHPDEPPSAKQLTTAIEKQLRLATGRAPAADDIEKYLALYERCLKPGSHVSAAKTTLMAVLLRTDAVYRAELGGSPDTAGRRMLTPQELATALSLALGQRRMETLTVAATKGELASKEQIAVVLRGILGSTEKRLDKSRLLGFFQEYFDYTKAPGIFKEPKFPFPEFASEWTERKGRWPEKDQTLRGSVHVPRELVSDTDRLVEHVLAEDHDVLRRLLTIDISFANLRLKEDKLTRKLVPISATEFNAHNDRGMIGPFYVYGFDAWPAEQPAKIPADKPRLGILMQPAWLVAHSTNFENDPVRRGRWIRERLLGGSVPEVPIGVVAQVPDEPHRSFRDRLQVTRATKCWKCHQRMDELGLPFEQFDHYGVFRNAELVVDTEATEKHVDKNGKPLGKVFRQVELITTGVISGSGDPKVDGIVRDPYELVRRLADSERVRQVFVRHAFRYFLGRNETLSDAQTLQAADAAYVQSGGSFQSLVISLLTSDSFLYRSEVTSGSSAVR